MLSVASLFEFVYLHFPLFLFCMLLLLLFLTRRLLERYQQHEKQLSKEVAMDAEVEDILTPDEKKQAESVKKSIAR